MVNLRNKNVATDTKPGVVKTLVKVSWLFFTEALMAKDPIKVANEFDKRLKAGEVKLLSAEESEARLAKIRDELKVMRKELGNLLKK